MIERLAHGDRWDLVFNIAEGLHGVAREAQVPTILDLFQIPYTFSDPLVMALALQKHLTKMVVRDSGSAHGRFCAGRAIGRRRESRSAAADFRKTSGRGHQQGHHGRLENHGPRRLAPDLQKLLEQFRQPVLVETFLPGREFTVGMAGTGEKAEVLGTIEVILHPHADAEVYSYRNKEECEDLVQYNLVRPANDEQVRSCEETALKVWRMLGCRDAGRVDMRCDARGMPNFIEANPLPGMHPQHSDLPILCTALGIPYVSLIERIVQSAMQRI